MTTMQRILLPAPSATANVAPPPPPPPPLRHLQPLAPALPSHHVPVARPDRVAGKPQLPGATSFQPHGAGFGHRDRSVPSLAAHAHASMGSSGSSSNGGHSDGEAQQVPGSATVPTMDGHVDILSVDSDEDGKALPKGGGEMRCTECGKCYRHSSGLHKHEWEHHELWNLTKTMCLSKHQQVQLLEAAKVLLALHGSDSVV